mgnify:CR=1 FL=1
MTLDLACGVHNLPLDQCPCPKGDGAWLGYRALWVAERRKAAQLSAPAVLPEEPVAPPEERPRVVLGEEYIDLFEQLDIDDFDLVMRALEGVVEQSASLALDDPDDRAVLIARLRKSVGCVVEREELRL